MSQIQVLYIVPEEHSLLLQSILAQAQKQARPTQVHLQVASLSFHRGFVQTRHRDGYLVPLGWAFGEAFFHFRRLIREQNIQIVHALGDPVAVWTMLASRLCGVPIVTRTCIGRVEKRWTHRFFQKIAAGHPLPSGQNGKVFLNPLSIPEELFHPPKPPETLTPGLIILGESFVPQQIRAPAALKLALQRLRSQIPASELFYQNLLREPEEILAQEAWDQGDKRHHHLIVRLLIGHPAREEAVLLRLLESIVQGIPVILTGHQIPMPGFMKDLSIRRASFLPKGLEEALADLFRNMNQTLESVKKQQEILMQEIGFNKHFDLWRLQYGEMLKPVRETDLRETAQRWRDQDFFALLSCPVCERDLHMETEHTEGGRAHRGTLTCSCGHRYALEKGVPRLSPISAESPLPQSVPARRRLEDFWGLHFMETFAHGKRWWRELHQSLPVHPPPARSDQRLLFLNPSSAGALDEATREGARGVGLETHLHRVNVGHQNLRDRGHLRLVQGDPLHPPFKPKSFARIVQPGLAVLSTQPIRAWKRWSSLLEKGGILELWVPVWPLPISPQGRFFEVLRQLSLVAHPWIIWVLAQVITILQVFFWQRRKLSRADFRVLAGIWFQWLSLPEAFFPTDQEIQWWIEDARLHDVHLSRPKPYLLRIQATAVA